MKIYGYRYGKNNTFFNFKLSRRKTNGVNKISKIMKILLPRKKRQENFIYKIKLVIKHYAKEFSKGTV
jgi:hypothetical protein